MRKTVRAALISVALMFSASSLFAQGSVLVVTEPVKEREFRTQIRLVGRTSPVIESKIVSEVSGRVSRINSREGVWISKNSPLITIDSERLRLSLEAKASETEQAKLQAELVGDLRFRTEELRSKDLVSQTTSDSVIAWSMIQKAKYLELDAQRKQMALDYENSTIRAPYSGFTGLKLVDVGEWVTPGMAVYELVDLSRIRITADLPERYFGHVEIGSKVYVDASSSANSSFEGTVTGISPNASRETHTYPVIIEVDNQDGRLGGGMLVRVTLSLDEEFTSLAISKDALIRQGEMTMVYTVDGGKAVSVPVEVTSTSNQYLAVQSSSLTAGMPVVIRGNERIYPGASVTTGGEPEQQPADSTVESQG
ncbi:MAG: efflux RND transporter periplasmic adaptor subunit [bacterium]|nr:efflux RND transporter periplasmic adaptor subunit [bacterium]